MASRSTARSWLSVLRLGEDLLRLRDGSLRGLIECEAPMAPLRTLCALRRPAQAVVRARRPSPAGEMPLRARLRTSQAALVSGLRGGRAPFLRRFLVAVPWDADEGGDGPALLRERIRDTEERLEQANLRPARLTARELDALTGLDGAQEGRCEVRAGGQLARTLIVTRHAERLRADCLGALDAGHDLSFHLRPGSSPDLVELSAYVTLWAETRGALDTATERAEALLAAHGIRSRRPYLQAEPALVSGLPLGLDLAGARRALRAHLCAAGGDGRRDQRPLLYGVDPGTKEPLRLDRFALANPHAVVLGGAAQERSRALALELLRACLAGTHVHVVDAAGASANVVSALGGQVVAPVGFDALSVRRDRPGALESRVQVLLALMETIGGGLSRAARAAVEDALSYSYAAHGHAHDGGDAGLPAPTLGEIAAALERRAAGAAEMEALAGKLRRYVAGEGRRLLDGTPPPRLGAMSVHDLSRLPEPDRPAAALLSLDRLRDRMPRGRPSLIVLGEAGRLLEHEGPGRFLAELMAPAPGRQVGLTLAAAEAGAILRGPMRDAALGAGLTLLLRQTPESTCLLAEALRLTPAEQSWLLQAPAGEGLLIAAGRRLAFRALASEEEERLITGGAR